MTGSFGELSRRLRRHLGQQQRFAHSIRVARCAELLAQWHGADTRKARLAGLLHDLARLYSPERLLAESEERGIAIGDAERAHPMLLHAKLGAEIARERFGIDDAEVLSAIEKHTTGAAKMSLLDCIVYLADSLEPGRSFERRPALWQLARNDLASAMRAVLLSAIEHNVRKGQATLPATLAAAESFGLGIAGGVPAEIRASAS
ncbi:MAG TPA: bis(5'-nucleosyl)-tetraphosphatase (symmetrical) YqeK [Candidatus Cybelea sp.]|jgi:predicted HD superfamily hydrolase involved in NAD metabolism|nr:bis(5'-nucleosyl)-tetraphosphatase (symmetrical) YqeK [Candidatus Cybelea sp.]